MIRNTTTAALVAALTVGWAQSAAALDLYAKPGGTLAEEAALTKDCIDKASKITVDKINPYEVAPTSGAGLIAASMMAGFINGVHEAREHRRFEDRCMRKAGWARIKLTDAEEAAYKKTPQTGQDAWLEDFFKTDIGERVQAGLVPKSVKLPTPAAAEPAVGGVRFDPAVLTVAAGPVAKGETLLSGKVAHRRTATLRDEVTVPLPLVAAHVPKGMVFQQVELRSVADAADDEISSYWCGNVKPAVSIGSSAIPECFWSDYEGYHFGRANAGFLDDPAGFKSWLVTAPNFQSGMTKLFAGPVVLDVSDTDLLGPLDFKLRFDKIEKQGVRLSAIASRDGRDVVFWSGWTPLDASGKAVAPLWTHRLTLTVTGGKVAAAYTPDGDGTGLAEVARTPPKAS